LFKAGNNRAAEILLHGVGLKNNKGLFHNGTLVGRGLFKMTGRLTSDKFKSQGQKIGLNL
jgi:hypothetical protein